MGNPDDVEDIVQEAYLKLWNMRDHLDNVKNPESFSVVVLKNLCFDYLRSTKDLESNSSPEKLKTENNSSLLAEIEMRDELRYVKELIIHLSLQQQKVIILRHIDECSIEEIEQIAGLNAVNIRVLLSRARKNLREQFNKRNKR